MQIHSVGIDLGKTAFHLVALSAAGKVLLRKKFTQKQLIAFTRTYRRRWSGWRHVQERTSWAGLCERKATT